jgi:hypothetical protein
LRRYSSRIQIVRFNSETVNLRLRLATDVIREHNGPIGEDLRWVATVLRQSAMSTLALFVTATSA